jgi:hypothetical protein
VCNKLLAAGAAGPVAQWGKYPRLRDFAEAQKSPVGHPSRLSTIVIERIAARVEPELPDTQIRF